jgi:hypothetical protein
LITVVAVQLAADRPILAIALSERKRQMHAATRALDGLFKPGRRRFLPARWQANELSDDQPAETEKQQ